MQGWLSLKGISFHSICSRRYSSCGTNTRSAPRPPPRGDAQHRGRARPRSPAHLLLLEDDLVEEELQVLVGVVDAELLKAVEVEVLREGRGAEPETPQPQGWRMEPGGILLTSKP